MCERGNTDVSACILATKHRYTLIMKDGTDKGLRILICRRRHGRAGRSDNMHVAAYQPPATQRSARPQRSECSKGSVMHNHKQGHRNSEASPGPECVRGAMLMCQHASYNAPGLPKRNTDRTPSAWPVSYPCRRPCTALYTDILASLQHGTAGMLNQMQPAAYQPTVLSRPLDRGALWMQQGLSDIHPPVVRTQRLGLARSKVRERGSVANT
jgi:hypothetical protein